jgi:hypothetical protein
MFKLTNKNMKNRGVTWKMGLNEDIHPFNTDEECCAGGIYYCSKEQLHEWCSKYTHICDIEIPSNAQVHHYKYKSKTSKMIIKTHMPIEDHSVFEDKEFVSKFVKRNGSALRFVKVQTPEICLAAVKRNGSVLRFVKEQTSKICLAAVKQDEYALFAVKNQTPEICMIAVKENGNIINFVKEQTHEMCMVSVKQEGLNILFVKEQTPEICLAAVKQNGWALEYVKEQTPEICSAAVKQKETLIY